MAYLGYDMILCNKFSGELGRKHVKSEAEMLEQFTVWTPILRDGDSIQIEGLGF